MASVDAKAAMALLHAGVDAVLAANLSALASTELAEFMLDYEHERRRLESGDPVVLAEVEQRDVAGDYGRSSTVDLMVEHLRVAPAEAKARTMAARDLGPRREGSGEPLEPLFRHVAAAQREGGLTQAHVRVITKYLHKLPPHLGFAEVERAELTLVEHARHLHAHDLAHVAERLLAYLDPDGNEPRERSTALRRAWNLRVNGDNSGDLGGMLTAAACAVWRPIIDALSAPQPDGDERDDRTPTQRRHDAFLEAGQRLIRSGTLPDCGGAPVTVLVRLDAEQLQTETGVAQTGNDDLIPIAELLQLASEADIIPTVLNESGGVLCYGRSRRLASPAQRRALALRDGGCSFPGCTRPPAWCEAHHVIPWWRGGRTDIDQMCLVCEFHHREFERRGWAVQMTDGMPEWIPPPWMDPERRPRRNTAHHLPEIDFGVDLAG
jgi:hypothetical protein